MAAASSPPKAEIPDLPPWVKNRAFILVLGIAMGNYNNILDALGSTFVTHVQLSEVQEHVEELSKGQKELKAEISKIFKAIEKLNQPAEN